MRLPHLVAFIVATVLSGILASSAEAACTLPFNLTNGQVADATQVMANFTALNNCIIGPAGSTYTLQYNAGAGAFGGVGPLTNGQVVIGSTGGVPQTSTLTAGPGIAITNGAGSITITNTGTAASYWPGYNLNVGVPAATSFTWVNQGSAAVTDDDPYGLVFNVPNAGDQWQGMCQTPPSPPYRIVVGWSGFMPLSKNSAMGAFWYDGTKLHLIGYGANSNSLPSIEVQRWSTTTSFSSSDFVQTFGANPSMFFVGLYDDGTNVHFQFSSDGVTFTDAYAVAKSSGWLSNYTTDICFGWQPNMNGVLSSVNYVLKLWDKNGLARSYP